MCRLLLEWIGPLASGLPSAIYLPIAYLVVRGLKDIAGA
jgi:hypothetical protein